MMEKAATLRQFPHLTLPRSSEGIRVSTGSSGIPLPLLWPPWLKPENAYPRQKRIVHPASLLDQQPLDHQKGKRFPEKHLLLLY